MNLLCFLDMGIFDSQSDVTHDGGISSDPFVTRDGRTQKTYSTSGPVTRDRVQISSRQTPRVTRDRRINRNGTVPRVRHDRKGKHEEVFT